MSRLLPQQFERLQSVLVLLMGGIYGVCPSDCLRWHDTHDIIKISSCIQVILQLYINNLIGCRGGITDGWDLRSMLLRWPQVA
jgi:hypothetical protein